MKVACLGDNCVDLYKNLNRYYCTGNVVDFGVHMKRLGIDTSIITTTGSDCFGLQMKQELVAEGIDVSHLNKAEGLTAISYMDLIDNERTYGEYDEGVMENISFSEEDIKFACSHDLVHTALWGNADKHLKQIHESGTLISFDYADEHDNELVISTNPYVDYGFYSFEEDNAECREFLKERINGGMKVAVATFGDKGSLAYDGKEFISNGIVASKVVNTVGAGDSYIAGFMNGVLKGYSILDCMKQGAEVSSKVVSIFDPWERRKISIDY